MWSIHITSQPYQKVVLIEGDKIYYKSFFDVLWVNELTNEQLIIKKSLEEEVEYSNRKNVL